MVPGGGLEPPRLSTPDPKSGASTNSATRARAFEKCTKESVRTRLILAEEV